MTATTVQAPVSPVAAEIARIERQRRRLGLALFVLALAILALLAWHGGRYYLLDRAARLHDPGDRGLRPSGTWGHGVGIAATLVMCSNFLYALRKHARWMQGAGPVPLWLTFHVFVGLLSPFVILFHAAFRLNNLIASLTYGSLWVVVTTGLIGRYIYTLVPGAGGVQSGELRDLERDWRELRTQLLRETEGRERPAWLNRALEAPVSRELSPGRALRAALGWPRLALRARAGWRELSRELPPPAAARLRRAGAQMLRLRFQIEFFTGGKRLMAEWRFGHSLLAIFLVVVVAIHVGVSLAFGYRWIF